MLASSVWQWIIIFTKVRQWPEPCLYLCTTVPYVCLSSCPSFACSSFCLFVSLSCWHLFMSLPACLSFLDFFLPVNLSLLLFLIFCSFSLWLWTCLSIFAVCFSTFLHSSYPACQPVRCPLLCPLSTCLYTDWYCIIVHIVIDLCLFYLFVCYCFYVRVDAVIFLNGINKLFCTMYLSVCFPAYLSLLPWTYCRSASCVRICCSVHLSSYLPTCLSWRLFCSPAFQLACL